ncbi:MAG: hypothetical protein AAGA55_04060 [Planctomycetota bacterium]
MKLQTSVLAALAGLASPVAGQSLSVQLSWDQSSISIGETATATVSATFTGFADGAYLSSVNIDLFANEPIGFVSNVSAIAWNNTGLGFDGQGVASGANILGIEAAQFSLIPPFSTDNPVLLFTFDFTATGGSSGYPMLPTYRARTVEGAPFAFSVTGPLFSDQPVAFGPEAFVLAPPVMVGLALGGFVCCRRRR